jgi:dihydropteroate synthase
MKSLTYNKLSLNFSIPKIMGIINLTDDSFYEGSRHQFGDSFKKEIDNQIAEGASIIDLGAQSTRPGAQLLDATTEIQRLDRAIPFILENYPKIWISIDTFYPEVAEKSLQLGAHIINDISAGDFDPSMLDVVSKWNCPYVAMHRQGDSKTMQINPQYNNIVEDLIKYFKQKGSVFNQKSINQWIIDPGFGFGKTIDHNYSLLNSLNEFSIFDRPILAGLSRKSMIYKKLDLTPETSLNGTTALNMFALTKGASILRVHDVKEAKQCVDLYQSLKSEQ